MSAEPPAANPKKTTLNAFDIACVVIGGIIGIGIFFAPSKVAMVVSSKERVIAAWAIGGVMIMFGAFVYARLAQLAPGEGGQFEYVRRAFGRLPAFLYGWCNMLVIQSGAIAIVGLVMADYLQQALGIAEAFGPMTRVGIAGGTIALLTIVNALGLILGKSVQGFLTVVKTGAVFGIVVIAMLAEPAATAVTATVLAGQSSDRGFLAEMSAAMLPVLFACGGWQHGSFVASVARRPKRDVPIGIVVGVAVVIVAYLLINVAYLDLLGREQAAASKAITVDAVKAALGGEHDVVARGFAVLVVISALGVMNTICMAPPYVLHAMARRGLFFPAVGRLHSRFGTPLLAILVQGGWAISLLLGTQSVARWLNAGRPKIEHIDPLEFLLQGAVFADWLLLGTQSVTRWFIADRPKIEHIDPLDFLLQGVVFADWLFYGACGVGLIVLLRRRAGGASAGGLDRAYGLAGALFALSALAVTVGAIVTHPMPTVLGLGVLALGVAAFYGFARDLPESS